MYNVIFLDFDYVLNNENTFSERKHRFPGDSTKGGLDPLNVAVFNQLLHTVDCKIVISSTWRKGLSLDEIHRHMLSKGFGYGRDLIIDKTPDFNRGSSKEPRYIEILAWLRDHRDEVQNILVLDDIKDFGPLSPYHVCTESSYGLTPEDVNSAREILNKEQDWRTSDWFLSLL